MITLLASIAGFISSIIPEIVKYFKDANDKKHELAILEKQIQYNQTAASRSLEEIHISRDILEQTENQTVPAKSSRRIQTEYVRTTQLNTLVFSH
jgi:arginine repressor